MATGEHGVDVCKLLKQVEHVLSARERQYLLDISKRDADLAAANQSIDTLNERLRQAECQCTILRDEIQKLAEIQSRELADHNRQLEELHRKHTELLEAHNNAMAKQAKRYDKVKKDRDSLASDLQKRKAELDEERRANQTLEKRLEAAAAKERSLSDNVQSLTARKKALQEKCSSLQDTASKYQTQLEVANKRIDDMKQDHSKRIQDLEVRLKNARTASKKTLDNMQETLEKQQEITQRLTEENLSYRRQLAERCDRHKRLEVANECLEDEVKLLKKQLKTSQLDCNQQRERVAQLEAGIAGRDKIIKGLEAAEKHNCSMELNAVRDELAQTKYKLSQLQGTESQLQKQLSLTEGRLNQCSANNSKLSKDLKLSLAEVTHYQQMCLDSQKREAQLAEQIKQAENLAEQKVKARLDEMVIKIAEQQSECLRLRQALANMEQQCRDLAAGRDAIQSRLKIVEKERDDLLDTLKEFLENEDRRHRNGFTRNTIPVPRPPNPGATLDSFQKLPPHLGHVAKDSGEANPGVNRMQDLPRRLLAGSSSLPADMPRMPIMNPGNRPAQPTAHKPTDGSVVGQLVSELSDALNPSQSKMHDIVHSGYDALTPGVGDNASVSHVLGPPSRPEPLHDYNQVARSGPPLTGAARLDSTLSHYSTLQLHQSDSSRNADGLPLLRSSMKPLEDVNSRSDDQPHGAPTITINSSSPSRSSLADSNLAKCVPGSNVPTYTALRHSLSQSQPSSNAVPASSQNTSQFVTEFLQQSNIENDVSRLLGAVTWSDLK